MELLHFQLKEFSSPVANMHDIAYRGPWDLEIPTNVIMFERPPITLPQPHPSVEVLRGQLVSKLRSGYQEMCLARQGMCCGHYGKGMTSVDDGFLSHRINLFFLYRIWVMILCLTMYLSLLKLNMMNIGVLFFIYFQEMQKS